MKCLLALFLLLSVNSKATTIIISKTDTSIIIGADSKIILTSHENGVTKKRSDITCKIHKLGNVYFAYAGSGYSVIKNIAYASCKKMSIRDIVKHFDSLMSTVAFNSLVQFRDSDSASYTAKYKTTKGEETVRSGEMCFAAIEDNKPVAVVVFCYIVNLNGYPQKMYTKAHIIQNNYTTAIGYADHVKKQMDNYKKQTPSIISRIVRLINLEIKHESEVVGPPIKIIEITKQGHKWLYGQEPCIL